MKKLSNWIKGFTLMELLVVISIIGILVAMGVATYSTAQKRGRDSRRKGDMDAMRNTMEQYYAVNSSYGSDSDCSTQLETYLSGSIPVDPKSGSYQFACPSAVTTLTYCICSQLEQGGDAAVPTGHGCGAWTLTTGRTGFNCVTELQ